MAEDGSEIEHVLSRSGGKVPQVGGTAWTVSVLHKVTERHDVQYNYDVLGMWRDLG